MGKKKAVVHKGYDDKMRMYACDFETTTGAVSTTDTAVWSFAFDEVGKYSPEIRGSIEEFFEFCADRNYGKKKRLFFHNLKFDGEFILWHALNVLHMTTPVYDGQMLHGDKIIENEIVYIIADTGQWYSMTFKYKGCKIEIRDSLKILPFTLEQIGKDICTHFKKSTMDYNDKKSLADCTPEDIEYIKNDVLVLSEAISFITKTNGEKSPFPAMTSLTIGAECYQEFKNLNYGQNKSISVKLHELILDVGYGATTADEYIRKGYRGGFCYVNPKIQGQIIEKAGFTADVNSLYPWAMHEKWSGAVYPYGKPVFKKGKPTPREFESDAYYFYLRVRVSFRLRDGFVPTVQKKNSFFFRANAYLESSAYMDFRTNSYIGDPQEIELTFSKLDFLIFAEHYAILSITYLDYCVFMTAQGMFAPYVEKFAEIKQNSTGATRALAKLLQNNLYGQMAKSDNSSFKIASVNQDHLTYEDVEAHEKKPVNIAIGAAITAKARSYQIATIQKNIDIFCYSDTDSLHCVGRPEDFKGEIDDKKYGAYAIENIWTRAKFVRQKTYIEELTDGSWNICAAGMTAEQKDTFRKTHDFKDFERGLTIYGGKLKPKHVRGGVILEEVDFTIK